MWLLPLIILKYNQPQLLHLEVVQPPERGQQLVVVGQEQLGHLQLRQELLPLPL